MAASARISHSINFHFHHSILLKTSRSQILFRKSPQLRSPHRFPLLSLNSHNHSFPKFQPGSPFSSLPAPHPAYFSIPSNYLNTVLFGQAENSLRWNFASGGSVNGENNGIVVDDRGPEIAVVMLGWLGAKPKHLRRYIELYNDKGIHAVTFVASVMDVLSFDLGKKLEERVQKLSSELAVWLSDERGRHRCLIFHTFSNTGWLAYGAILDNLKDRQDLLGKIKGCVVDSGGDPNIDPKHHVCQGAGWILVVPDHIKVWAAGFTTALLKKSSSATYPSTETGEPAQFRTNGSKTLDKEPFLIEALLLFAFEKIFSYLLNLPDINQRLTKIISGLRKDQPCCPQFYLYSSGDKVIPFQAVESFIEEQKRTGKQVFTFNFGSSPHVDHYRTFPDLYASQLHVFLKECLTVERKL